MSKLDLLTFVQSFGECGMRKKGLFQLAQNLIIDNHFTTLSKDELVNLLWVLAMYWNANADRQTVQRILIELKNNDELEVS